MDINWKVVAQSKGYKALKTADTYDTRLYPARPRLAPYRYQR